MLYLAELPTRLAFNYRIVGENINGVKMNSRSGQDYLNLFESSPSKCIVEDLISHLTTKKAHLLVGRWAFWSSNFRSLSVFELNRQRV
jgi:hypothetical protein